MPEFSTHVEVGGTKWVVWQVGIAQRAAITLWEWRQSGVHALEGANKLALF